MRVVITGSTGNIGRAIADDLAAEHEVIRIDRRWRGRPTRVADIGWRSGWQRAFEGADVVLHLAAVMYPADAGRRGWRRVLRSNIAGTWHVLDAAVQYSVPRIVYGSSTWAIRGRLEEALEATAGPTIDSNAPPRPWRTYGLSKAFGEVAGRMLIDEGRLEAFVSVRIGFCPPDGIPPSKEDHLRFHWVGKKDMTSLLRRCVEADISGYHVVYGVSDMPGSRFNLSHTRALLAWNPSEGRPGASSA